MAREGGDMDERNEDAGRFTQEELEAIWLQYQRDGAAACPYDGAELVLEVADDAPRPEVRVHCPSGGRRGAFAPPDSEDVQAWAE